ncbi:biotin-independent malonate decarboxylase subunit beta [Cryobacterium sp. AP23]
MNIAIRPAFTELTARERVRAVLDPGSFREILGPFVKVESPHLFIQGIVPQSDDGAVIGRGTVAGVSAVVVALDGGFQGGGIGEVSGAKLAASLERAITDNRNGIPTRAIILLETGGIRLQEANLGLLAIAEIHAAIVELRGFGPVVGVIAGTVGCFGGMAIAAGLTSHLVMTPGARMGLNGPEVIETEAGVSELDASDRPLIWSIIGGSQRVGVGQAEILTDDDVNQITQAVHGVWDHPDSKPVRSELIAANRRLINQINPDIRPSPADLRALTTEAAR